MPTNPFDISVLDGVIFDAAHVGYLTPASSSSTGNADSFVLWAGNDPVFNYAQGPVAIYGTTDQRSASGISRIGTGRITVLNSDPNSNYTPPGTLGGGTYRSPRFGQIKFANATNTYNILGFSEDGRSIIISKSSSTYDAYTTGGAFVLSLDLLPAYTNASPPPQDNVEHFGNDLSDVTTFHDAVAALCFAEGTRIATPAGPVAVEALAEGGMVLTAAGVARPINWIGQMLSRPASHPRPWEVQPVRVRANAFGSGCPEQDVRLSPGHAVYVDGVLVPVGNLINGATIVQEEVEQVRYFHVELDSHDVLLADGLPCESYLDDGNRASFANAGEHVELHGRLDPKSWDDACAPMVAAGPQLVQVQQRLHEQAEAMGWIKTEAADLVIEADGVAIAPLHQAGNRFWFAVPAASALTLRSNAGVLAHVMPGLRDGRRLGVAVTELHIDGAVVDLDDAMLGQGFYGVERHETHAWRWTNGSGELAPELAAPAMVEVVLAMVAPSWVRPAPQLRVVA